MYSYSSSITRMIIVQHNMLQTRKVAQQTLATPRGRIFLRDQKSSVLAFEIMGKLCGQLSAESVQNIGSRLSEVPGLRLPANLGDDVSVEKRLEYLNSLLVQDPGVFLERYGKLISKDERKAFEPLRGSYEVDLYIRLLESEDSAAVVKNRRLAHMNKLVEGGEYFSEAAMRSRAPLMHKEMVQPLTSCSPLLALLHGTAVGLCLVTTQLQCRMDL